MTEQERDRVCVVLVRARNPSNIGAAARAMHDFGFSRLRVVNEFAAPFEGARSAVDASEVLARAVRCASVAEAVADCTLVAGATAVGERNLQHKLLELAEAAPLIRDELRRQPTQRDQASMDEVSQASGSDAPRVALLFGSEKFGLSNEDLTYCHWLIRIGTRDEHASMNLGQAVAICLYELRKACEKCAPAAAGGLPPATCAEQEAMFRHLQTALEEIHFLYGEKAQPLMHAVRHLLGRAGLSVMEVKLLHGLARQIRWHVANHRSTTP